MICVFSGKEIDDLRNYDAGKTQIKKGYHSNPLFSWIFYCCWGERGCSCMIMLNVFK
jgi:hypothetical protein